MAAANDPEFREAAESMGMEINLLDGEAAGEQVSTSYDLFNRFRDSLKNPH